MKKCDVRVLIALAMLLAGSSAWGLQLPVGEDVLALEAQAIVVGNVVSAHSYWDDASGLICTDYEVLVSDSAKGMSSGVAITVKLEGGEVGDIGLHVSEEAQMRIGDKCLLYLEPDETGKFHTVRGSQGKLSVANDTIVETGERVSERMSRVRSMAN